MLLQCVGVLLTVSEVRVRRISVRDGSLLLCHRFAMNVRTYVRRYDRFGFILIDSTISTH